jgi:hypothetical protein
VSPTHTVHPVDSVVDDQAQYSAFVSLAEREMTVQAWCEATDLSQAIVRVAGAVRRSAVRDGLAPGALIEVHALPWAEFAAGLADDQGEAGDAPPA